MDTPTETKSQVKHGTAGFPSSSGKSFNGFFSGDKRWNFRKNDLIDARARRLFETTAYACENDAYPFQIPLEGRTGPQVKADGHSMLMLSSYDYLGLIGDPRIDAAAIEAIRKYGTGTGGARLLTGTTDQHVLMEQDLAAYKGTEAAIAAIKMAYIRQQASMSHPFNQPLLTSGAIQIEETPVKIENE